METQLKAAIGSFFNEFSKFEMTSVGLALQSLARDPEFVERSQQLLGLQARLKLVERMAFVRGVPPALIAELTHALGRARRLLTKRDAVARSLRDEDLVPPIAQLREHADEVVQLQGTLRSISRRIDPFLQAPAEA